MAEDRAPEGKEVTAPAQSFGLSRRVLGWGVVLTIGGAIWVAQVEMILHTAEICESVPLIAALAGLIFLILYNRSLQLIQRMAMRSRPVAAALVVAAGIGVYLLHIPTEGGLRTFLAVAGVGLGVAGVAILVSERGTAALHTWQLSRREIILIYCFLTLSALMISPKLTGYIIPQMTMYEYFGFQNPSFVGAQRVAIRYHRCASTHASSSRMPTRAWAGRSRRPTALPMARR